MIISMTAQYPASSYGDALAQAIDLWRDFMEDPSAELPWSANIRVELEKDAVTTAAGETVGGSTRGTASLSVKMDIEKE